MSGVNQLRFDGYYVSVWTNAESFVFRNVTVKMDSYLRFYESGEVIAATIRPLQNEELINWISNEFSRWTKEDFENDGKPAYYNVNDDPNHPYIITKCNLRKKSRIEFEFKWYRGGSYGKATYEGTIVNDTIELMIIGTEGQRHREIFKFVPFSDIKYTTRKESGLYRNFVLHHFTSQFGGKPIKFKADTGLPKVIPHFDIYYISPNRDHPYYAVFTCGMGENRMNVRLDELKYAELCLLLPPDWKINNLTARDSVALQPFKSLMLGARYPFQNRTYLADGHVVMINDCARGINFVGELITNFSSAYGIKNSLNSMIIDNRIINVYGVVQLYWEELNFKIAMGSEQLMNKFNVKSKNPYIFTPNRENLVVEMSIEKIDTILKTYKVQPNTLVEWHVLFDRLLAEKESRNLFVVMTRMEAIFPEDYFLWFKKAILASEGGIADNSVMEQSFKNSVERNPNFPHSWLLLGNLYVERKIWDKAIDAYTKYTMLEPSNPEAWKILSTPYVYSGLFEKGLEILHKAKELDPNDVEINIMIRKIEVELGRIK